RHLAQTFAKKNHLRNQERLGLRGKRRREGKHRIAVLAMARTADLDGPDRALRIAALRKRSAAEQRDQSEPDPHARSTWRTSRDRSRRSARRSRAPSRRATA